MTMRSGSPRSSVSFRMVLAYAAAACMVSAICGEVQVWEEKYPPPPKPVKSEISLGVYIFPGWYRDKGKSDYPYPTHDEDSEWRLVAREPRPRPLLGFYDDSMPEVNDWHIKWALEHGISFFAFDWYWNAGEHRLMRTLERGFLKAKYAQLMKFCVHWCNHGLDWRTRQWYPMMGLTETVVRDGVMTARVTNGDPAFGCPVRIDASAFRHVLIRMKLDKGNHAQLFWGGRNGGVSETNSITFETVPDGKFHDYLLDLGAVASWSGSISHFRFDPNSGDPRSTVALDSIKLLKDPEDPQNGLHWEFDIDSEPGKLTKGGLDFTPEALVRMIEYMADTYFELPNYLTIDGRPVLMVWNVDEVIRANDGPKGFADVLATIDAALRNRGLKDLYLVSVRGGLDIRDAGFAAVTGYGYYGVDFGSPYEWRSGHSVPYDEVVKHYESTWEAVSRSRQLPYIVPIGSNWDSRPRHGDRARVITGKTPAKFKTMCENSLKYIDKRVNMAIIEAWNEWGEGSFIEPDKDWGFGFLDAVRDVFTDAPEQHVDFVPNAAKVSAFSVLAPAEVEAAVEAEKLPYPDPPFSPRPVKWLIDEPMPASPVLKAWEFNGATAEGWGKHQIDDLAAAGGTLSYIAGGPDPQIIVEDVGVAVRDLGCLALRIKACAGVTSCELFWSTTDEPKLSARKSLRFPIKDDGQWHTYQVSRRREGKWDGVLAILRLDMGRQGDRIEIDWIRFLGPTE